VATHQFGVSGQGVAHRRGHSTVVQSSSGVPMTASQRREESRPPMKWSASTTRPRRRSGTVRQLRTAARGG
jgi:hypothetical protein